MSIRSNRHTDNFAGRFDGAAWPMVLMFAGMFALAAVAWMIS